MPKQNTAGATYQYKPDATATIQQVTSSNLYTLFDPDLSSQWTGAALHVAPNSKLHRFDKTVHLFRRISPAMKINMSSTEESVKLDAYIPGFGKRMWMSTADIDITTFGMLWYDFTVNGSTQQVPVNYDLVFKYYVQVKGFSQAA